MTTSTKLKRLKGKFFLLMLTAAVLMSSLVVTVNAVTYVVGGSLGTGTINSVTAPSTVDGVTYSKAIYTDAGGRTQAVYTLEFNPKTGDYVPLAYSSYAGSGARVATDATNATAKGYNTLGGINADFFSMSAGTSGVLVGYGTFVTDGRVATSSVGATGTAMAFSSDGSYNIVSSSLDFAMTVNNAPFKYEPTNGSAIAHINKRSSTWDNRFYYWDRSCGTVSDSTVAGIEIICEKDTNSDIIIGGTLRGTVVQKKTNSYGSAIGENQFILYCKSDSSMYSQANTIVVGDEIGITVTETIAASAEIMKKANTIFTAAVPFVKNGVNVTNSLISGGTIYGLSTTERAQRTAIGVKANGSIVMIASAGRGVTDSADGLTITELADIMVQLGCVDAINLDGGGSTQLYFNGATMLYTTRAVGNTILVSERPEIDASKENTLTALLDDANAAIYESGISSTKLIKLQEAYSDGAAVLVSSTSMPGDYTRSIMALEAAMTAGAELNEAIAAAEEIFFKDYSAYTLKKIWEAYEAAKVVASNPEAGIAEQIAALYDLKTALGTTGAAIQNITKGAAYKTATVNPLYPDTDGYKLTDGVKNATAANSSIWTGFHIDTPTGTFAGQKYVEIALDLDKVTSGIRRISTTMLNYSPWGAGAATNVKVFISDNGTTYTEFGNATLSATPQNGLYQEIEAYLNIPSSITARYIKFRYFFTTANLLISEVEAFTVDGKLNTGLYLTGTNKPVTNDASILFTPGYAATLTAANSNLSWATVIVCSWDNAKGAYIVNSVTQNSGSMANVAVPANGFVFGVHHNSQSLAFTNKAYANAVVAGQQVNLNGIDIASPAFNAGAYITFSAYTAPQVFFSTATIYDDTATIDGVLTSVISGITESKTVYNIMHQFKEGAVIYNASGQVLSNNDFVGTGAVITSGGRSYTVIVNGDTSGDGRVTAVDYLRIKRAFLGNFNLDGAFLQAGKVSGGDSLGAVDYLMIKRHFIGSYNLFA